MSSYHPKLSCKRSTKLEQRPVVEQLQVLTQKFYDVALSIFTDEWLELEDEVDVNDAQSGPLSFPKIITSPERLSQRAQG